MRSRQYPVACMVSRRLRLDRPALMRHDDVVRYMKWVTFFVKSPLIYPLYRFRVGPTLYVVTFLEHHLYIVHGMLENYKPRSPQEPQFHSLTVIPTRILTM